jgi:hypothetical protein
MSPREAVLAERDRIERLLRTEPVAVCGTGYDRQAEAGELFYASGGNYVCVRIMVNSLGDQCPARVKRAMGAY